MRFPLLQTSYDMALLGTGFARRTVTDQRDDDGCALSRRSALARASRAASCCRCRMEGSRKGCGVLREENSVAVEGGERRVRGGERGEGTYGEDSARDGGIGLLRRRAWVLCRRNGLRVVLGGGGGVWLRSGRVWRTCLWGWIW